MQLQEIGIVRNAYKNLTDIPRQGRMSEEVSEIEIHPDFADGLLKIEQNKYLIVLYWAHLAKRDILKTLPPASKEIHGVFASRSPGRPNPLSLCIVELIECGENILRVKGLDALDGSSVVDIKPYTQMDAITEIS
ncbi:tRNA (N6-threonylcarbamoyladenosine(37)-N6)-methyltransferase TrmO [uncultured Selenomonas sp.]|uniref:tRNA (N6-threonylcarbamoyladenosine(37)-N6)-methyltransferase TrmO n=1 Tax=uncultured Selenomonas sp. TaxID=159275 RepID=UPI0028E71978|nr:tRNA (N6-threonylcarbamoyladenosine(37)-N6)-methyltransferase TrmO [uncultured Selenomonas sp.]